MPSSEPAYYISIPNKKDKKKIIYSLSKEEGNKLQFTSLDGKDAFTTTKRDLMLNLQVSDYDISKDPSYLK
ncbi:MAG: hypothetical protein WCI60_03305 [bacterium]